MPVFTLVFCSVLCVIYILDTFILIPKSADIKSKEMWLTGHNKGYINRVLHLSESKIKKGQIWRLVSSSLLHIGVPHIAFNIIALIIIGFAVEPRLGSTKTALCFIVSVLVSGLFMSFVYRLQEGEGASTGIFGLFAVFILLAVKNGTVLFSDVHPVFLIILALYAISGMVTGKASVCEHISGFAGGLFIGIPLIFT